MVPSNFCAECGVNYYHTCACDPETVNERLLDEIYTIRAENERLNQECTASMQTIASERARADRAEADRDRMAEALRPFAELYIGVSMSDTATAACTVIGTPGEDKTSITAGDVRRARAALNAEQRDGV